MPVTCILFPQCPQTTLNIQKRCRRNPSSALKGLHRLVRREAQGDQRKLSCPLTSCWPSTLRRSRRVAARKNPQIVGRKLDKRFIAAGWELAVATEAQGTELEQLLLAIAEEHAGDHFGAQAVVAGAGGDPGPLEADDAGGQVAGLERTAGGAPQLPALA